MNRRLKQVTVTVLIAAQASFCSPVMEISTTELTRAVERDGVSFPVHSIPDAVLDRLAAHRVVLVGETHLLREHHELMEELLLGLHSRGFRQLMLEWAHTADWLLADYIEDLRLEPDWAPPVSVGGSLLRAIREFNRTVPIDERIGVRAIDVNLADYGGGEAFTWSIGRLARHLPTPGPLAEFLDRDSDSPVKGLMRILTLHKELQAGKAELITSWGQHWYDTVAEMVEVELSSLQIRALRDSDYDKSVRLREDVLKRLADRRLGECPHGTVINVGGNHAQKQHLKGTRQEWLGDYLVHRSRAADGSVIVLAVTAARIISAPGSQFPDFDLRASPNNELFRVMNRTWPEQIVFLPVDDPLFASDRVPMNFEGIIHLGAPKRHYDVFIQLPLAHRLPLE